MLLILRCLLALEILDDRLPRPEGLPDDRQTRKPDWRASTADDQVPARLPWDAVRHVVIIPNYKESVEKLRPTLAAMAAAAGARETIIPVLAMEEADPDARAKADRYWPSSSRASMRCS